MQEKKKWISPEPSSLCPRETLHSLPRVWTLLVPVALLHVFAKLDVQYLFWLLQT